MLIPCGGYACDGSRLGDETSKLGAYVDPLDPPVGRRTLERCSCHDTWVRLGHLALKLGLMPKTLKLRLMSICDPGVARRTLGSG